MLLPSLAAAAGCRSHLPASWLCGQLHRGFSTVVAEAKGHYGLLQLNRPQALNALSSQVANDVVGAVEQLASTPGVRSIIVSGAGRAFAAGADIREMATLTQQQASDVGLFKQWDKLQFLRMRYAVPLIAAVHGFALGGGFEVAMMCDLIIAADNARFGLPETTLGVIPGMGGTQRAQRLLGRAMAADIILTARRIDADTALRCGLVSRVVPQEQLLPEAVSMADAIAKTPNTAVRAALQAAHAADTQTLEEGLRTERRLFYGLFDTRNKMEGMQAFLEKRPARFEYEP